jgi:vacuolar-type H+-ATPase subunit E/Vma4
VGAETLLKEVEDRRRKALEQLEVEYAAKKAEVAARTTEQSAYVEGNGKTQALMLSERERTRIAGAAKLQAKKLIFDATEKMLANNLAALKQALADYAGTKEYPELLSRMAKYASGRLGGSIEVICRPGDVAILKKAGAKVTSSNLNSIGGFKAESANGELELDLTFEEVLRSHEEDARAYILNKE